MKNLKTTVGILVMILVTLTVMSCKDNKKDNNRENGHHTEIKGDGGSSHDMMNNSKKSSNTNMIVDSYLQMKNALVQDNKNDAANAGKMMISAFSNFDMMSLTEEQHEEYMEIVESAKEQAEHIVKSPIDHQREHFEILSIDVNDLITLIGTDKQLYQDFCPMYNDGKGAIWLSETKEIKNPFLGSKMLSCGEIQKEIN